MSMPPTEAAIDAIMSNPNVIFAIARLAICYAESMHLPVRTNATIRAEDEVLSRVGKAVWFCVQDATKGGARGEAPKAVPVPPHQTGTVAWAQGAGGGGGAQVPIKATTVKIPDGATTAAITLGPSGASIAFEFAAPTRPTTAAPPDSDDTDKARAVLASYGITGIFTRDIDWSAPHAIDAEPMCRATEADAGVCEPHRGVCDNWSAAFPISAPDGVCGGGR